ncbi:MAG TPA: hypothetical protein PL124_06920 [Candidatus Cloacimonadota bacterium]|nr:hypothetical protein [Candidatus Cloacimonadota bacterium]HPS39128.1 hypothetical protein [Candidatus Cloacimonadota bacterium]
MKERHFYWKVRIWHLIWLLVLALIVTTLLWFRARITPEIITEKPRISSDGAVVKIQIKSKLPLSYEIDPFYLQVKAGGTILASAIATDNPVTVSRNKPGKLVFDFKLDNSTSLLTKITSFIGSGNLSVSAEIPVRIMGMSFLIPYSKTLQL